MWHALRVGAGLGSESRDATAGVTGPKPPCKHSFTSQATFKLITRITHAPSAFFIANTETWGMVVVRITLPLRGQLSVQAGRVLSHRGQHLFCQW